MNILFSEIAGEYFQAQLSRTIIHWTVLSLSRQFWNMITFKWTETNNFKNKMKENSQPEGKKLGKKKWKNKTTSIM